MGSYICYIKFSFSSKNLNNKNFNSKQCKKFENLTVVIYCIDNCP